MASLNTKQRQQIAKLEKQLLQLLDFRIHVPTIVSFLELLFAMYEKKTAEISERIRGNQKHGSDSFLPTMYAHRNDNSSTTMSQTQQSLWLTLQSSNSNSMPINKKTNYASKVCVLSNAPSNQSKDTQLSHQMQTLSMNPNKTLQITQQQPSSSHQIQDYLGTPSQFLCNKSLHLNSKEIQYMQYILNYSHYLCQLAMIDESFLNFRPSVLAIASLCVASQNAKEHFKKNKTNHSDNVENANCCVEFDFNQYLLHFTTYNPSNLQRPMELLQNAMLGLGCVLFSSIFFLHFKFQCCFLFLFLCTFTLANQCMF